MPLPLRTTFRNMPSSEAVERSIGKHVESLGRLSDRIMGCRVVVEARQTRHQQGNLFHVRIGLTVPGGGIVAGREPATRHAHDDVYVALGDAFDAARRQVEDYERRHRRKAEAHDILESGRKGPQAGTARTAE